MLMMSLANMTDADLRTRLIESMSVAKDPETPAGQRALADAEYVSVRDEIRRRGDVADQARRQQLLRRL